MRRRGEVKGTGSQRVTGQMKETRSQVFQEGEQKKG
jgi:hypothetical protein